MQSFHRGCIVGHKHMKNHQNKTYKEQKFICQQRSKKICKSNVLKVWLVKGSEGSCNLLQFLTFEI